MPCGTIREGRERMSSNLVWAPVRPPKTRDLPDKLKFVLRQHYEMTVVDTEVDADEIGYYEGLADAGLEGAQKVVTALKNHATLRISEVF